MYKIRRKNVFFRGEITESQNSRGWKGPLGIIYSNTPVETGSPTAGCTGTR